MKWSIITKHIIIFYVPLDAFAGPIYVHIIDIRWIFNKKNYIFIGYSVGHRGYKCLDVSTGKIFVSRHVVFDESLYPYTVPESIELTP